MKKTCLIILLFLGFGWTNAQSIKIKNGKVIVDKKNYLTYKGDVFYSLDGLPLFTLQKETVEKENPNKNDLNTANSDLQTYTTQDSNASDPQRRGNRYSKPKKVKYVIVRFSGFSLEYESTLSVSKILKEFYQSNVVNAAGIIDQETAKAVAYRISKNVSGKRKKIE